MSYIYFNKHWNLGNEELANLPGGYDRDPKLVGPGTPILF